jgi:hypothetical protein
MLLVNLEDVLKLTRPDIRMENPTQDDNKYVFFNTDKFLGQLDVMNKGSVITADMLADIFRNSFSEGHIDYTKD